jgi:hypothetical protein
MVIKTNAFYQLVVSLWIAALTFGLSACSLGAHPGEGYSVLYLAIQGQSQESMLLASSLSESFRYEGSAPSTISDFNCLAVNVMGEGVASIKPGEDVTSYIPSLLSGSTCAYPGILSEPIFLSAEVRGTSLLVPDNKTLIIQVVGIQDIDQHYCIPQGSLAEIIRNDYIYRSDYNAAFYEIGRSVQRVSVDGEGVYIKDTYSALSATEKSARRVDCDSGGSSRRDTKHSYDELTAEVIYRMISNGEVTLKTGDEYVIYYPNLNQNRGYGDLAVGDVFLFSIDSGGDFGKFEILEFIQNATSGGDNLYKLKIKYITYNTSYQNISASDAVTINFGRISESSDIPNFNLDNGTECVSPGGGCQIFWGSDFTANNKINFIKAKETYGKIYRYSQRSNSN